MTTHAFAAAASAASNPFAPTSPFSSAPRATFADAALALAPAAQSAAADATTFALVQSGPAVPADEVESHLDAVEVTVRWGSQVLSVAHLPKGKSFHVGEGAELALPEDLIGAGRAPIVLARGEGAVVVLPPTARGTVTTKTDAHSIAALVQQGATEITLLHGMTVSLELGADRADGTRGEPITFEITTVRAGKVAPIGFLAALAGGATGFVGLSLLGHAAIVASLAMFMPKMGADDSEAIDRDQLLMMQKLLNASAEREPTKEEQPSAPGAEEAGGSSTGAPHKGESGAAGTTKHVTTDGRMGFKGTDGDRQLSRKEELETAKVFGMAGILAGATVNDPNAPSTPWAVEFKGADEKSAFGKMFGQDIADTAGFGVGLWGTGEGGGGTADVIGLDHVNTVGGGGGGPGKFGIGKGDKDGMGNGHGPGAGGHQVKTPILRTPQIQTNGRLPPEVIQRIVRQNFGRFRLCYETGLRQNPALSGRVATKFVIGRDGAVSQASDAGSDLPDREVVSCIVRGFHGLSFPSPEGGIATVTYPIILSPGE